MDNTTENKDFVSSCNFKDQPYCIREKIIYKEDCDSLSESSHSSHSSIEDKFSQNDSCNKKISENVFENIKTLSKAQSTKSKLLWVVEEFISSEKIFIKCLNLLCDIFASFVKIVGDNDKLVSAAELSKIISPLPQLLSINQILLKEMELRLENWSENPKIADIIVQKGPFLKLYSFYIRNYSNNCTLFEEFCQKHPQLQKSVKDFEMSDASKKLAIRHYMLKPIQRIPQYRLLLENYLKHQSENSVDYEDTIKALEIVSDVANHANKSIRKGDNESKLLHIQSLLKVYIMKPNRELIKEGDLYKLSRKEIELRYIILLNDCLLYTSYHYSPITGLNLRYEFPLSEVKVSCSDNNGCSNEFNIITTIKSFTLRAKSPSERDEWVTNLKKAIGEYNEKKKSLSSKAYAVANGKPSLGDEAPIWIQDCNTSRCESCRTVFTVVFRRHHCRACGKIVCGHCSKHKARLRYKNYGLSRVCNDCYNNLLMEFQETTKQEIHGSETIIKTCFGKSKSLCSTKVLKNISQYPEMATDFDLTVSSWLYKYRFTKRKKWIKHWFVLKEKVLYEYETSENILSLNSMPVLGFDLQVFMEGTYFEEYDSNCVFQLSHQGQKPLIFRAETKNIAVRWITALNEAIQLN